ncbi:MAG: DUF2490 domain-containing protein, partial [Candidatus Micrarchaeaceae archaeon]
MNLIRAALLVLALLVVIPCITTAQTRFPMQETQTWDDGIAKVRWGKGNLLLDFSLHSDFGAYYELRGGGGYSFTPLNKGARTRFKITVAPRYRYYLKTKAPHQPEGENRLFAEITPSLIFKKWTFSDRSRPEYRIMAHSGWRYRNQIEVATPTYQPFFKLSAFARYEFFYTPPSNWREGRYAGGFERAFNNKVSADVYYLRQWGVSIP